MNLSEFRRHGHELIDWMAEYFENIENLPVKSGILPGEVLNQLPAHPPSDPEAFENLMNDFNEIIMPGITHWQHPGWHAYFTANNSYPSILAEMLTSTLGAQCMSWLTSPAATELEERVMEWLGEMTGLPKGFTGVIQDTASTATLVSLLTARENATRFAINRSGFYGKGVFTIYCSSEAHSSIERAVKIAGFGQDNLRKIEVDKLFAMKPESLESAINSDLKKGFVPLAVVAAIGTTGSTAIDPLKEIGEICKKHKLWLHVDAAWAGTAMLLPEFRYMIDGIENVDTFVFNPHKWMFTNFDCSAYFVKDKGALIQTFEILPEYLKTKEGSMVNNYRDWGVQLGRRFRALKLWFVIRTFGVKGLQEKIRNHIRWADEFAGWVENEKTFEILAPSPLATVCFRLHPAGVDDEQQLNSLNARFLDEINQSEKIFMTHTKLNGKFTLRFVVGQTNTERHHIEKAWEIICGIAMRMK
nr:aminotransferase class V-fold PLP-dependent enzyme [Bacteroidota bacterium]